MSWEDGDGSEQNVQHGDDDGGNDKGQGLTVKVCVSDFRWKTRLEAQRP